MERGGVSLCMYTVASRGWMLSVKGAIQTHEIGCVGNDAVSHEPGHVLGF